MNRIFITGCQKSGTTLLARMFSAFEGVYVCNEEVSLEEFVDSEPWSDELHTIVGKRTVGHIFSDIISEQEKKAQLNLIKKHDIKIINMVRDGREVVESIYQEWGIYNPFMWMDCIMQMKETDIPMLICNYEHLVKDPNNVQEALGVDFDFYGQAFSDYPDFVPKEILPSNKPNYKLRKLKLKKYNSDRWRAMPNNDWYFEKLNKELGYE